MQYLVHKKLADLYFEKHHVDLAADHYELADKALEEAAPDDPRKQDAWHKEKKKIGELHKFFRSKADERKRAFELKTATRKPMERVYEAIRGSYSRFTKENKEERDPEGWGLTGMTLQLLQAIDPASLPQEQQPVWGQWTIDLLFRTGRARGGAPASRSLRR